MDALSGDKAPEVHWWLMKDHQAHCRSLPSTDATTRLTVSPKTHLWRPFADFVGPISMVLRARLYL